MAAAAIAAASRCAKPSMIEAFVELLGDKRLLVARCFVIPIAAEAAFGLESPF